MHQDKDLESQRQGENLESSKEKLLIAYKGSPIRLRADRSSETWRTESSGMTYSKYWRKRLSTKSFMSRETTLQKQRRDQDIPDKHTHREFVASRPGWQEILNGVIQAEIKITRQQLESTGKIKEHHKKR